MSSSGAPYFRTVEHILQWCPLLQNQQTVEHVFQWCPILQDSGAYLPVVPHISGPVVKHILQWCPIFQDQ